MAATLKEVLAQIDELKLQIEKLKPITPEQEKRIYLGIRRKELPREPLQRNLKTGLIMKSIGLPKISSKALIK